MPVRILFLVLALLRPFASSAGDEAARVAAVVDGTIRPLMSSHDIPGMAVALTVEGRHHLFSYGVASRQSGVPVTGSTLFEIGSISKVFTATLAAYAQATGRLALDDHPGRHLPELKGRPVDRVRLHHLGTYTAGGLPLQFPDAVGTERDAMAFFGRWQPRAEPGRMRQYSNPSIGLLGVVTAAAMKDGYANLVETHILRPLGMNRTWIDVPPHAMADYAWGYRDGTAVRVHPGPLDDETYGIKSTAADLLRLLQANIDPEGLAAPLREAIRTTQVGRYRLGGMVQGLGWEQFAYPVSREALHSGNAPEVIFDPNPVQPVAPGAHPEPRLFDKTGSTGGFSAYVAFVPARRFGLVMLANSNVPIAARVEAAHAMLEQVLPRPR